MAAQIDHVISQLRNMVLSGELHPGERIIEIAFAAKLGVSRTPLRIALSELETEGLLERLPSRGFRVRSFSVDEIADAVDVRGLLEGMAARIVAERGMSDAVRDELTAAVRQGRALLEPITHNSAFVVDAEAWRAVNNQFHRAITRAAGNRALESAIEHNNKVPMAGPGALTLPLTPSDLEITFVLRAQADHEDLLVALTRGEGARAESLVREHAYRSRENKRVLITRMQSQRPAAVLKSSNGV